MIKPIVIFIFVLLSVSGCYIPGSCSDPTVCCYPIEKKQKPVDEVDHSQGMRDSQIPNPHSKLKS